MHLQTDEAWRGQLDSPVNQTHETRGMVHETNTAMDGLAVTGIFVLLKNVLG